MINACKKCRREGTKLLLKGERCLSVKCAITKRNYAPGDHGQGFKGKMSDYGKQLREKQKARRIYNISESQFKGYVAKADKMVGNKSENLMKLLELRIDNVIYRLGFAVSRSDARQKISHGLFTADGHRVNTPSYQVKIGQVIKPKKSVKFEELTLNTGISWLATDNKSMSATIKSIPTRDEIDTSVNESLIIEYYSR